MFLGLLFFNSSPALAEDNLVLHLKLDDSATSTTYVDSSGNNNNGTYLNNYQRTLGQTGVINGATLLGGDGDHIRVLSSNSLKVSNVVTIEAWIKPNFPIWTENYQIIANKHNDYELGINKNGQIQAGITNSSGIRKLVQSKSGLVKIDSWSHVAMTYDGSIVKLFVNGSLVASDSFSGQIKTSDLPLLLGQFQGNYFYSGWLDDLDI